MIGFHQIKCHWLIVLQCCSLQFKCKSGALSSVSQRSSPVVPPHCPPIGSITRCHYHLVPDSYARHNTANTSTVLRADGRAFLSTFKAQSGALWQVKPPTAACHVAFLVLLPVGWRSCNCHWTWFEYHWLRNIGLMCCALSDTYLYMMSAARLDQRLFPIVANYLLLGNPQQGLKMSRSLLLLLPATEIQESTASEHIAGSKLLLWLLVVDVLIHGYKKERWSSEVKKPWNAVVHGRTTSPVWPVTVGVIWNAHFLKTWSCEKLLAPMLPYRLILLCFPGKVWRFSIPTGRCYWWSVKKWESYSVRSLGQLSGKETYFNYVDLDCTFRGISF